MVFKINNVDIMPYIAAGGLKWSHSDISGSNKMTMQNGLTNRDRIASKYKWQISCKPLTAEDQATVLSLIAPEYVTVQYTDPQTNTLQTGTFYSDSYPSTYLIKRADGTEYWGGLAFPLEQR